MKYRADFVTNSSSANYVVTLKVDGDTGQHAEIMIHTYDFDPWYKDTEEGFATHDRQAHALSYRADDEVECAQSTESVRELCDSLLSAVHEYGWGLDSDWWSEFENVPYFRNRWLRDRLLAAQAEGKDGSGLDLAEFDLDSYLNELRGQGKQLNVRLYRTSGDDICQGWSFCIVGAPRIYNGRKELERFITEHGGVVDQHVSSSTDFVIYCEDGMPRASNDEVYWTLSVPGDLENLERFNYDLETSQDVSYLWQCYRQWWLDEDRREKGGLCNLHEYCRSFEADDQRIDALFEESDLCDIMDDWRLDLSQLAIPEHEFVRRFDPTRERTQPMPYHVAHPIIAKRFAQLCEARGITPQNLKSVTYEKFISTFDDSTRLLGFLESDRGTRVDYSDRFVDTTTWGDDEDIDWAYRKS